MHHSRASLFTFLGLLSGLAFGILGHRAGSTMQEGSFQPVFIIQRDIGRGRLLSEKHEYFTVEYVPAYKAPPRAVRSRTEMDGMVSTRSIWEGTVLTHDHLVRKENYRRKQLPEELRKGDVVSGMYQYPLLTGFQDFAPWDPVVVIGIAAGEDGKLRVEKLAETYLNPIAQYEPEPGKEHLQRVYVRMTWAQALRTHWLQEKGIVFLIRKDTFAP